MNETLNEKLCVSVGVILAAILFVAIPAGFVHEIDPTRGIDIGIDAFGVYWDGKEQK